MDDPSTATRDLESQLFRMASEANSACIDLLRDLVTLPSPSRGERLACERVVREMENLGSQDIHIDAIGTRWIAA